ncbi:hypothetical protein KR093_004502 [Drosophila rubida]|uniref:Receptor protein-tyrosine kinase n=1 Tax=Drosophila rubida TaxID=30044 RepID=A0AAD4KDU4_9MUSC|nr:hypothetical protein KR093_004502 [Drosophila rubida]
MWRSLLALLLLSPLAIVGAEKICGSIELRQLSDFEQLRNCNVVVGHVRIANLQLPDNVNLAKLRTNVTEITDYLLIYHTTALLTAQYIFPQLRLIRGRQLLFDQYAFVVYENRNLRELGLQHLVRIQSGNIRIENNPMLCFVDTVDWIYLLANSTKQHFSIKGNRSPNHCPVCGGLSSDYSYRIKNAVNCWSLQAMQLKLQPPKLEGCPASCGRFGCDASGSCCDRNCLTGCASQNQNCTLCANYARSGRCVDQCIASYELHKRQCIDVKECRQRKLIPLTRGCRCVDHCPDNHKPTVDANGARHCQLECKGVYHVKRAADLEQLQDCVTINGSLIIELVDVKEKIVAELEQACGNIKEITGYLKVIHSTPLMSLTFLRSLDTIRGDELIEKKYALFVVNNAHLEHIWPTNRQVAIQRGTIFFHLNPRLCYDKIESLLPVLRGTSNELSIADVSPNSNGERNICGDAVTTLDAQIVDINSTAVTIVLDFMKYENMSTLLGYTYHYMEAPRRNVTKYDGRHGCGHDNWLMDVSNGKNRRHMIVNLKPYMQYAYFVKTLTRLDYHLHLDAYSPIQYFRTLPSKPSPVRRLYGVSDYSTQIMVHWWPPQRPNGNITHYILNFELHNLTKSENSTKNYASDRPFNTNDAADCECNDLEPYYSGPQPDDDKFYNRAQTTYEESLPDLIYVSRRRPPPKKEKFDKVVDFADLISGRSRQVAESQANTTTNATANATANATTNCTIIVATNATTNAGTNATTIATTNCTVIATTNCTTTAASNLNSTMICGNATTNGTKVIDDSEEQYNLFRKYVEEKSRLIQDTDQEKFIVQHDQPKCLEGHASVANSIEQKCVMEEELTGIKLPGSQQYYNMTKLLPNQYYRVTVRACVEGVVNGCSSPAILLVKTISVEVEQFLKGGH